MPREDILRVVGLTKYFPVKKQSFFGGKLTLKAVDNVSITLKQGETLGIVGESGCGKSTLAKTIARLITTTNGKIYYKNNDITHASFKQLQDIRPSIHYVFQDPYESLNPRHTIQNILEEPFLIHTKLKFIERKEKVEDLLHKVGLPTDCLSKYPHEFSGGQRQRIGIARAIALEPDVLICDEPVSALDVSVQSQIINLLMDLQDELGLGIIFIAHDLAVVKHISDRIAVMYLGRIVETSTTEELFKQPQHPYTQLLMNAIPNPDPTKRRTKKTIKGELPSPIKPPIGCNFQSRCKFETKQCETSDPNLSNRMSTSTHQSACHHTDLSTKEWESPWEF
jgi:oligopeptide/dipeptide ABC transporter ATP-binding protein